MGLTGDGEEGVAGLGAAETAPAGGCAGFGGSGALSLGLSGSTVGASSGGGSWATATLVPHSKTDNDHPRSARNIGLVSRLKDDLRKAKRLPWYHRSARPEKSVFLGAARTSPCDTTTKGQALEFGVRLCKMQRVRSVRLTARRRK
jgi:hypothetical protein